MEVRDALRLDDALSRECLSDAWVLWSGAADGALLTRFVLPVPDRGLVLGRGTAQFKVDKLGGPKVRMARNNVADPHDGGDVFMCRDSSIAPLLISEAQVQGCVECS